MPDTFRNVLTCDVSAYYDEVTDENRYDYPSNCDEVLTMGFNEGDGNYTLYPNGSGSAIEKQCRFVGNEGYTETVFNRSNEDVKYLDGNGNLPEQGWDNEIDRFYSNGWELLINAKETTGVLVKNTGGPLIDRYATRDLPLLPEDMSAIMNVNSFRGGADGDRARLYFQLIDYNGTISTIFDTGYYSSSRNKTYAVNFTIPATTYQVRWWGRCYRRSGSTCETYIANLSLTLNPELLADGGIAFAKVIN